MLLSWDALVTDGDSRTIRRASQGLSVLDAPLLLREEPKYTPRHSKRPPPHVFVPLLLPATAPPAPGELGA
jgi:hypothetical protein